MLGSPIGYPIGGVENASGSSVQSSAVSQINILNPAKATEREKIHATNSLIKQVRQLTTKIVTAKSVTNTPAGNIASTTVQDALNELDTKKLPASSYTATDVFSKVLTKAGSGSGLNADLLDGNDSTAFSFVTRTVRTMGSAGALVIGDAGNVVLYSAGSGNITVPSNANVAFPINTQIDFICTGAGGTFAPDTGVTINSANSLLSFGAQHAAASLLKVATNTWQLFGSLQ